MPDGERRRSSSLSMSRCQQQRQRSRQSLPVAIVAPSPRPSSSSMSSSLSSSLSSSSMSSTATPRCKLAFLVPLSLLASSAVLIGTVERSRRAGATTTTMRGGARRMGHRSSSYVPPPAPPSPRDDDNDDDDASPAYDGMEYEEEDDNDDGMAHREDDDDIDHNDRDRSARIASTRRMGRMERRRGVDTMEWNEYSRSRPEQTLAGYFDVTYLPSPFHPRPSAPSSSSSSHEAHSSSGKYHSITTSGDVFALLLTCNHNRTYVLTITTSTREYDAGGGYDDDAESTTDPPSMSSSSSHASAVRVSGIRRHPLLRTRVRSVGHHRDRHRSWKFVVHARGAIRRRRRVHPRGRRDFLGPDGIRRVPRRRRRDR